MPRKPIKRHQHLQPFSREHHHGLVLCWNIKKGLTLGVSKERIINYVRWFWNVQLEQHSRDEEQLIFPLLGMDDPLIKQAIREHRELKALIFSKNPSAKTLENLHQLFHNHIRFEERILFDKIQDISSEAELAEINKSHKEIGVCYWEDPFWKE